MAQEILSVKLYEMDKEFAKLHSRIELSGTSNSEQIQEELKRLQRECKEGKLTLQNRLKYSRSKKVQQLAIAYEKIENIISETENKFCDTVLNEQEENMSEEEIVLLAEYSLDFAMQAANNALLLSLEAIQKQINN